MIWRNKIPEFLYKSLISLTLLTMVCFYFYLLGTYQSFQAAIIRGLFITTNVVCWLALCLSGLLTCFYLFKNRTFHRKLFIAMLALVLLTGIFILLHFIKVWIYN